MCRFYQNLNLTLPSGPPKNGVKSRTVYDPGSEKYALYKNCGLPCHCTSAAIYNIKLEHFYDTNTWNTHVNCKQHPHTQQHHDG
jgi:hypothetical protein